MAVTHYHFFKNAGNHGSNMLIMSRCLTIKNAKSGKGGFSLIELLLVVAIISIISTVVLASNSRYGGSVLLQNLAYDIALSIRQSQVYGISVRGSGSGSVNAFNIGYGMHFLLSDPTHYELFADANNNGLFDPNADPNLDENVPPSPYTIGRGYKILHLCAPAGTRTSLSPNEYSCSYKNQIDVLFKRPEPDACISVDGTSAVQNGRCTSVQPDARIILESPRGDQLSIVIDATGQISVQ